MNSGETVECWFEAFQVSIQIFFILKNKCTKFWWRHYDIRKCSVPYNKYFNSFLIIELKRLNTAQLFCFWLYNCWPTQFFSIFLGGRSLSRHMRSIRLFTLFLRISKHNFIITMITTKGDLSIDECNISVKIPFHINILIWEFFLRIIQNSSCFRYIQTKTFLGSYYKIIWIRLL